MNITHYFILIIIILQILLINTTQPDEIKSEISTLISELNSETEAEIIEDLSSKGGIYKTEGQYSIQISYIDNQSFTSDIAVKYPQVKISQNCINKIKEKYTDTKDVIVTKLFTTYSFEESSTNYIAGITKLTDVIYYQFFPFINNKIDTSKPIDISSDCGEKVIIYGPLYIDDHLKYKFVAVAGQNPKSDLKNLRNYDIFDPNAKIYKDICYTITFSYALESHITKDSFKNYDISLQQRKKHYFPGNLYLCPEDCSYLGTDKDTVSTMCECEFDNKFTLNGNQISVHTTYTNFTFDEKKFNKTKKDNYFSMETFKCIKLPFTKSGFKGNYGSIIMIAIICIILLSYIVLLISGKYHLLSVLELLYNSNIKSMNYIKNPNIGTTNAPQSQIPYDARSNNNLLLSSQRGLTTNGMMMSLNGTNSYYSKKNPIQTNKRRNSNSRNNSIQILNKNNLNKNKPQKEKNNLIDVDEIQENDYESEGKDKTDINNSINKEKDNNQDKNESNKNINNDKTKDKTNIQNKQEVQNEPKNEEKEEEEDEISSIDKNKEEGKDKEQEQEQVNNSNKDNDNNKKEENKDDEDGEEEDEDEEEEEEENDNKANPPKKKHGSNKQRNSNGDKANEKNENGNNGNENGNANEEKENKGTKTKKKRKSKTPIEIALNVKELKDMMFKNMPQGQNYENGTTKEPPQQPKKENTQQKKPSQNNPKPQQNNPFNLNPFLNPLNFMPPPYPFNYNNNGNSNNEDKLRREYEDRARQRELEYQREKELANMREKERQREMDDLRERERQRQRDLDYERERRQRDDLYRNLDRDRYYDKGRYYDNYDRERNEEIIREKERLNHQNEEIKKMKEKLQKEYDEQQYKDKERDLEIQKELNKVKDLQKQKEIEFEKELLKQKEMLKEQFEKEKKEIIEQKDKEMQRIREEKDREIQRLKEDKDREIKYMKEDMDREIKDQDEKIKKKEKQFKKEKEKLKEMQKMTSNSFFNTMQQQIIDMNNNFNRYEKIEKPQIVVPINSIFTDQELNAMNYDNSIIYDKRTLCQIYMSYINRKHPLLFLFNYNSTSSNSVSTFQINYKSIKFIIFGVELMIYMFFYATFFGSKSITHILNGTFNFKKKLVFGIILTPFCMIAKSVIQYFVYDNMYIKISEIKMRCYTNFIVERKPEEIKVNDFKEFWESDEDNQKNVNDDKKEEMADIQEIEDDNLPEEEKIKRKEKYERRKLKTLIKELIEIFRKKILISFLIMILVLFIMWIYISAFCAVYKNSQLQFFVNIIISFAYSNVIPFIYCLLPTIFRQEGVKEQSKFSFFIGKIFHIG